jgi:hypothetical protein
MVGAFEILAGGFKLCPVKILWINSLRVGRDWTIRAAAMPVCMTFTSFW